MIVLSRIKIIVKKFEWYRVEQPVMGDVVVKWNSRCIVREVEIALTYQCSYFKSRAIEDRIDKGSVYVNISFILLNFKLTLKVRPYLRNPAVDCSITVDRWSSAPPPSPRIPNLIKTTVCVCVFFFHTNSRRNSLRTKFSPAGNLEKNPCRIIVFSRIKML